MSRISVHSTSWHQRLGQVLSYAAHVPILLLIAATASFALQTFPTGRRDPLRLSKIQATIVIYVPLISQMCFEDGQERVGNLESLASTRNQLILVPLFISARLGAQGD